MLNKPEIESLAKKLAEKLKKADDVEDKKEESEDCKMGKGKKDALILLLGSKLKK